MSADMMISPSHDGILVRLLGGWHESHEAVLPSRGRFTAYASGDGPTAESEHRVAGKKPRLLPNGPVLTTTFGELLIDVWVPRSHCIVHGATVPQSGNAAASGATRTAAMPSTAAARGPAVRMGEAYAPIRLPSSYGTGYGPGYAPPNASSQYGRVNSRFDGESVICTLPGVEHSVALPVLTHVGFAAAAGAPSPRRPLRPPADNGVEFAWSSFRTPLYGAYNPLPVTSGKSSVVRMPGSAATTAGIALTTRIAVANTSGVIVVAVGAAQADVHRVRRLTGDLHAIGAAGLSRLRPVRAEVVPQPRDVLEHHRGPFVDQPAHLEPQRGGRALRDESRSDLEVFGRRLAVYTSTTSSSVMPSPAAI